MDTLHTEEQIVFVVDDNADVRAGLGELLGSVGLKSEAFASAAEFLRRNVPDTASCLVLDVRLPGLSGLDFQADLARAEVGIPIIFITGHGDIPMSVRAMKAGAVEFLTKPIREQELLDAVQLALSSDRARRERERRSLELRKRFGLLNAREREVMAWITRGLMNKQVAARIGISEVTVKVNRHNLMKKLGVKSVADLVRMADRMGLPADR